MMNPFLQVAIGGAIGATARYSVYRAMAWHGPGFPVATGVVNVAGSFVMGLLAAPGAATDAGLRAAGAYAKWQKCSIGAARRLLVPGR